MRYQARSSVISSRFSRSFQPHSLCSYLGDWGTVRIRNTGRGERPGAETRPAECTYMVCMLVFVRSKAQSTVAGSSPDTRLHSMETFNLGGGEEAGGAGCWPSAARWPGSWQWGGPDSSPSTQKSQALPSRTRLRQLPGKELSLLGSD